ncbi:MAG: ComF family protein [Chitinophagales bacterium]|nr:ComF family protein [Chitinophagales bacterium]
MSLFSNIIFSDAYRLFFPRICPSCNNALIKEETYICLHCSLNLPLTNFESFRGNPVEQVFEGRVDLNFATSLLFFSKHEGVQNIMHQIKYNNQKELAVYIGQLLGERLMTLHKQKKIDAIIPVPLHPKKQHQRGYNQSEYIAQGINKVLNTKIINHYLIRKEYNSSQTKKNRMERWDNVAEVFQINSKTKIAGNHFLLVDDVLTTGATLEACSVTLKNNLNCELSIATICYAM